MSEVRPGQIRRNPGGRVLLVLPDAAPRDELRLCLQLSGQWRGQTFGVKTNTLEGWVQLAHLPPDTDLSRHPVG